MEQWGHAKTGLYSITYKDAVDSVRIVGKEREVSYVPVISLYYDCYNVHRFLGTFNTKREARDAAKNHRESMEGIA